MAADVPGTVAGGLRAAGLWNFESAPRRFDSEEWWYRARFAAAPPAPGERVLLGFDGLATLAEVWLNGAPLLRSSNMFVEHHCDVGALLGAENELLIRFAPVETFLQERRPRPRWRTPMVANQQLRWVRTTLLGRTPGWSPPAAAVGPWRPVYLERRRLLEFDSLRLQVRVDSPLGAAPRGRVTLFSGLAAAAGVQVEAARLIVERAGTRCSAALDFGRTPLTMQGEVSVPNVQLWWPHTHGDPVLYRVLVEVSVRAAGHGDVDVVQVNLGHVGFRMLDLDRSAGGFSLSVNGVPVFCRGASWTPLDCVSLVSPPGAYAEAFETVVQAGMNMLRVAGPMVYESEEFLDSCDARGILLWQDFMFANMDYPAHDDDFLCSVRLEARQQLARLQARPALAILCGNSEGAQQAAMSGAAREHWAPALFETELAGLAREYCPDVAYSPSSAHGGALPQQSNCGAGSYYGVGAYLRPLTDARRAEVRFASECLAFANVPENETLALLARGAPSLRCHHALWKERVPRDLGAGWDFDDVRDFYAAELYRADPMRLRYADHDRYLRVARATGGEAMAACFGEWRRARSSCRGALVWFLRDLWAGAGWGIIDSTGLPKAPYYYLKRALQPVALFLSDEGTNGLSIHVLNDGPTALPVRIELRLFRFSEPVGTPASKSVRLAAASAVELAAADLIEGGSDLSYAYRFGPPPYDVLDAVLSREDGTVLAEAFYFPLGMALTVEADIGLTAHLIQAEPNLYALTIHSRRFAQSVHVDMPGFIAQDQYFHMAPNSTRNVVVRPRVRSAPPRPHGTVHALNAAASCRIEVRS
jgi:beta-mannosidase